ncbi:hypothetical protein BZZ01_22145 [Nostocales cyanobacterium HT-58-2]|nr:hypothetical protein BZZ01_22145 [Nostocales cyanobacterium HT-58-2]
MTQSIKTNLQESARIVTETHRGLERKKKEKQRKIFFCLLPFTFYCLLSALPAYAETEKNSCPPRFVLTTPSNNVDITFKDWDKTCGNLKSYILSFEEMLLALNKSNVVYLGEIHNNPKDHKNQLKIIQELYKQNPKIAIAMEMFQKPYQGVVNQYLAGKITEEELIEKSEYEKRWGFPWQNYAPILNFAKEKQLSVITLNTPSEITRKVAQKGLESLTPSEQKLIPPLSEIQTNNEEYRQQLESVFQQHQAANHGNSTDIENFFQAQVLWDETMAEGIAKFRKTYPNYQIIVLAGQGHIIYDYGIPSRVARRLKGEKFIQRSVLLSPPDNINQPKQKKAIADFVLQGGLR